ncbi:hypothetical protein TNCT_591351 [Trichonephila clavata]|uniref:Uncharacterized protein n=1 Tax=Trichonephila clavata TaxID=2740835 RepID=A0A8X6G8I7_TRICU|nr:hypothetical protein TNCT_591351 [Trichonephila clavata]
MIPGSLVEVKLEKKCQKIDWLQAFSLSKHDLENINELDLEGRAWLTVVPVMPFTVEKLSIVKLSKCSNNGQRSLEGSIKG